MKKKQINEGGKMKKLFLSILAGTLVFGAIAYSAEEATTVTAKVPEKPWSISTTYSVSRAIETTDAIAGAGSLTAAWKWSDQFSSSLTLGLKNAWGTPNSLAIQDAVLALTAPSSVKVPALGLDFTPLLSVKAPMSAASRNPDSGFYVKALAELRVAKAVELGVFKIGGANPLNGKVSGVTMSYNAARSKEVPVPEPKEGEEPKPEDPAAKPTKNLVGLLGAHLFASVSWLGLDWGTGLWLDALSNHDSSPVYSASVTPSLSWGVFEIKDVVSVSLLGGSSVSYSSAKGLSAETSLSPSVSWTPVKGASVDLSYSTKFENRQWKQLADFKKHEASLGVTYTF
ncbi:MAG: hypothetical protein HYW47_02645 [Deltaproteobacteria bacterium]|nr:hypothetical protein [Deltaproteobacteria bacterium]